MTELPLFITDPADNSKKFIGTKQVHPDGSLTWFRRLTSDHVMRSGSFGVDAMTYDTQFAGRIGTIKVEFGATVYETPFSLFERLRKEKDLGHGRQYFLAFAHWQVVNRTPSVGTKKEPVKLEFGVHRPCPRCKKVAEPECELCHGRGYVDR